MVSEPELARVGGEKRVIILRELHDSVGVEANSGNV